MSNLVKRTLSALILAPLVIFIIYKGGYAFLGLIILAFLTMMYEWTMVTRRSKQRILWIIFGFFYIGFACFTMLFLERWRFDFQGITQVPIVLFALLFMVWINDIFAYIFGRAIGGPKLWPSVSPNKTWAGFIGGITGCVALFFVMNYLTGFGANQVNDSAFFNALLIHMLVPVIATAGDLFESSIKRRFGVKDSGNIIPGHGGLLDRMDGVILVMNVAGIFMYIMVAIKAGHLAAQGAGI